MSDFFLHLTTVLFTNSHTLTVFLPQSALSHLQSGGLKLIFQQKRMSEVVLHKGLRGLWSEANIRNSLAQVMC